MRPLLRALLLLLALITLNGCERFLPSPIAGFRSQGELKVAIRDDGLAFRSAAPGTLEGLEFDLLKIFGEREGIPVRFIRYPDVTRMLRALDEGEVHLAAGGMAQLERDGLQWSQPLRSEEFVLAAMEDHLPLNQESDLAGRTIGVRRGSPAAPLLQAMAKRVRNLQIVLYADSTDRALMDRLRRGLLDAIATDRSQLAMIQGLYPDIEEKLDLQHAEAIRWAMRTDAAEKLPETVNDFLAWADGSGLLARTEDRYLTALKRLSSIDIDAFLRRMKERLPPLKPYFHEAQEITGIDWRFLAALAYQESQWDPLARSFTGVRGVMMLTEETADRLGIDNRLDPRQSILGGARYFSQLLDQFEQIDEPDRTWIATAAYNLGPGHLNGARSITRNMGKDPDTWMGLRSILPLLSRPAYAARLRGGPARGGEAVVMTENVRGFHELLMRVETPYSPPLQLLPAPTGTGTGLTRESPAQPLLGKHSSPPI